MPESGGEYTYLLHGIHAVVSYLYCYMTAIVMKPAPVAILGKVRTEDSHETLYANCAFVTGIHVLSISVSRA